MAKINQNVQQIKKCYVDYLSTLDWTYFITGSTRYELTLKSVRRLMDRWFNAYRIDGSRLFWVAEKFEVKDGFHAHGLLYVPGDPEGTFLFTKLIDHWQWATGNKAISCEGRVINWDKAGWNALNLKVYDKKRGAGGYCAKYVFKNNSDYDLLC
jgi:hypothetical protein